MPYSVTAPNGEVLWFADEWPRGEAEAYAAANYPAQNQQRDDFGVLDQLKSSLASGISGAMQHYAGASRAYGMLQPSSVYSNDIADWLMSLSTKVSPGPAPDPDSKWEAAAQIAGQVPGMVAETGPYLTLGTLAGGPVLGGGAAFGLHGMFDRLGGTGQIDLSPEAIREGTREGIVSGLEGAALGAVHGAAGALKPLGQRVMTGLGGFGIGYAGGEARHLDKQQSLLNAAFMGAMGAAFPGRPGRKIDDVVEETLSAKQKTQLNAALKEGQARGVPPEEIIQRALNKELGDLADAPVTIRGSETKRVPLERVEGEIGPMLGEKRPMGTPRTGEVYNYRTIENDAVAEMVKELIDNGHTMESLRKIPVSTEETVAAAMREGLDQPFIETVIGRLGKQATLQHKAALSLATDTKRIRTRLTAIEDELRAARANGLDTTNLEAAALALNKEYAEKAFLTKASIVTDAKMAREAARAQAFRRHVGKEVNPTGEQLYILERHNKLTKENMDKIFLGVTDEELSRLLKTEFTPSLWDKYYEFYLMGLLSNPLTHVVNITSNASLIPLERETLRLSVAADKLRPKGERLYAPKTMQADTVGFTSSLFPALKEAFRVLRDENYNYGGKIEAHTQALQGPLAKARYIGRALSAEDAFFRAIGESREAHKVALERLVKDGVNVEKMGRGEFAKTLASKVKEMADDPVTYGDDLLRIRRAGERVTFTEPLPARGRDDVREGFIRGVAGVAQRAKTTPGISKAAQMLVPFTRTPANIADYALRHTPMGAIGLLRELKKSGGQMTQAAQEELSRAVIGTGLMSLVGYLTLDGKVTGGGPVDYQRRAQLEEGDWQPYSIKIGDRWYSYARIEPFATIFGLVADTVDVSRGQYLDENDSRLSAMMNSITNNLTNKTFMLQVENFMNAMSDPKRYGEQFIESLAASQVPFSSFMGMAARISDPSARSIRGTGEGTVERFTSGMLAGMKSRIPGLRQTLPERHGYTGFVEQQPLTERLLQNLTPFRAAPSNSERVVENEINRLITSGRSIKGLSLFNRGRTINGERVELTEEEYAEQFGPLREVYPLLEQIIMSPSYSRLTDESKVRMIEKIYSKARGRAGKQARRSIASRMEGQ